MVQQPDVISDAIVTSHTSLFNCLLRDLSKYTIQYTFGHKNINLIPTQSGIITLQFCLLTAFET
jgi:hypothetical protein